MGAATIIGVLAIVACMAIGMNFHPIYLSYKVWMIIVGLYIAIASVTPVWILLQPRDYLSSFLLYAMLAVALVGVFVSHADLGGADGLQAFEGFAIDNGNGVQYMFLFSLQQLHVVPYQVSTHLYHQVQHPSSLIRRRRPDLSLTAECFLSVSLQL